MSCPFYGKHAAAGFGLVDQHGNQCAIVVSAYAPCVMETTLSLAPDADDCPLLRVANEWRGQIIKGDLWLLVKGRLG